MSLVLVSFTAVRAFYYLQITSLTGPFISIECF